MRMKQFSIVAIPLLVMEASAGQGRAEEAGDPAKGKEIFQQQCGRCHAMGDGAQATTVGPALNGIVGRRSGEDRNFNYSPQLRSARLVWDSHTLSRFLKAPKSTIPGTKMLISGLASPTQILDVIAYISQFDENGVIKR